MTHHNAIKFIKNSPNEIPEGSSEAQRIGVLLEALGNPQKKIKYIRLAGTSGKTISARMLIAILNKANIVNGCLSMPIYEEVRENIRINGDPISIFDVTEYADQVNRAVAQINKSIDASEEPFVPTTHEIMLCIALLIFEKSKCDICILEGNHKENDPSKFLPPPIAAVICGKIPSDNTQEIAKIRAFISRGIREIVSVPQDSDAYNVIADACYSINCRLTLPSKPRFEIKRLSLRGTDFTYKDIDYSLRLCGKFQTENALIAIESADMLLRCGYSISTKNVQDGLLSVNAPCKFEVISISPTIIADSTHSSVAIDTVCDSLSDFKTITGTKIRLCLPEGELIHEFIDALSIRGYSVERVSALISETPASLDYPVPTAIHKNIKLTVRDALNNLESDCILLISGPVNFTKSMRYELWQTLGF